MKRKIIGIIVATLLLSTSVLSVAGNMNYNKNDVESITTNWFEQAKLIASDGADYDEFGYSVSIDGEYAIVGAKPGYLYTCLAYIFKKTGTSWTEEAKLSVLGSTTYDNLGIDCKLGKVVSVSISGRYAIIGAYHDTNINGQCAGSAYVFKRSGSTWTKEAKLIASDGAENDYFGFSVSLDGDTALIGSICNDNVNGERAGSAYVFKRSSIKWTEEAKLIASDGSSWRNFGFSVSLDGDYAIVGSDADAAYIFKKSSTGWTEEAKLTGSGNDVNFPVSLNGEYAVVGAYFDDSGAGSAYVFKRNDSTWTEEAKLNASDRANNDFFGCSVSLDGDTALIGAFMDDNENGNDSGSAYMLKRSGSNWTEMTKLIASDGAEWDEFGYTVAIDGDTAIIGAHMNDNENGHNAGSAYIFTRNQQPENQPPNKPTGTYDKSNDELVVTATDPDGDQVKYGVSCKNNGNVDTWTEFHDSGEEVRIDCEGNKRPSGVIAEDEYGAQSSWVTIRSKSKQSANQILLRLLDMFPNIFPLLRFLLKL